MPADFSSVAVLAAGLPPLAVLAAGLVLLYLGGEALVRGAVGLSRRLGVSPLLIGIVVVAFGTSAPELFVAIDAVLSDAPEIAVGNVIGSNIANVMFVLALAAVLAPIADRGKAVIRDGATMLAATGLFLWFASRGAVTTEGAYVLLGMLAIYLVWSYLGERVRPDPGDVAQVRMISVLRFNIHPGWIDFFLVVIGIAALVFGAKFIIMGGVEIARVLGVSEAVIGVSMIAVGTSLPELAAVGIAAARKQTGLVVGGIVGSNIFNILSVIGITALVAPLNISPEFLERDVWVMLGAAGVLALICTTRWRFGRIEGLVLLLGYGAYIYALYYDLLPKIGAADG